MWNVLVVQFKHVFWKWEFSSWKWRQCCFCAIKGCATCFNCGCKMSIAPGPAGCIQLSEDVDARVWAQDSQARRRHTSVCKEVIMPPFSLRSPVLLPYSPNPQEMTRRGSGWWICRAGAADHGRAAHTLGSICSGCLPPGTNGIMISREIVRIAFRCL